MTSQCLFGLRNISLITKGLFREKVRHVGEENVGWYVREHTACFKQVLFFIL